jgi:predicted  nucleic acid-binding Zn-ribbon protein
MKMQQQYDTMNGQLQKSRDYYGHASAQDRASLRTEILNAEKQVEQMQLQIRQMEKDIRQAELAGK